MPATQGPKDFLSIQGMTWEQAQPLLDAYLSRLTNRLDAQEGRRGTPTFYADSDFTGHAINNAVIGLEMKGPPADAMTWRIRHNFGTKSLAVQIREYPGGLVIGPAATPSATIDETDSILIQSTVLLAANSITVLISKVIQGQ